MYRNEKANCSNTLQVSSYATQSELGEACLNSLQVPGYATQSELGEARPHTL